MSLNDTHPTEYFGPHAKRWTSPTGQVLSLRPADYDDMVNKQMELDFNARLLEEMEQELTPVPEHEPERPRDDTIDPVSQAIADQYGVPVVKHADWPDVIAMDTAYSRIDPETAALFKDRGVLIMPGNVQTFHDVDPDFAEKLSGGTTLPDGWMPRPVLAEGDNIQVVSGGQVAHFTLNADGSIAEIHPFQEEAGEPAARHLKPGKPARAAAAALLLYVIIVIGVAAVAGVML